MAQLGARFHGMEEVVGSNPTRSTKTFQTLTVTPPHKNLASGVQLASILDAKRARAAFFKARRLMSWASLLL